MHPELAARPLHDARRLADVIRVRMSADDEAHVLDLQAAHFHRPFEMAHRSRLVHASVYEDDPVARLQRPSVAVRNAWPWKRQPQAPDAGQHPFATTKLALASTSRLRSIGHEPGD